MASSCGGPCVTDVDEGSSSGPIALGVCRGINSRATIPASANGFGLGIGILGCNEKTVMRCASIK